MPKGEKRYSSAQKVEGKARDYYISTGPTDYVNKDKKYEGDAAMARIRVGDYGMKKLEGKKKYSESTGEKSTYTNTSDR